MGCDGGTIPRRDELVRVKKKAEMKDRESELSFQWQHCAITQEQLQEPIAACHLGRLYNKMSLIEALLNKDTLPDSAKHIKNLKDVVELKLTKNPVYNVGDSDKTGSTTPYICPVIGLEMAGKFRFVALWSCGCVFSERALKEVSTNICHKCQKPFSESDVVILNGNEDDLTKMKDNMNIRQQVRKNKEKKKRSKLLADANCKDSLGLDKVTTTTATTLGASSSKAASTSVSTSNEKQSKLAKTTGVTQNLKKRPGSLKEPTDATKKMKPEYSLAKDPYVSDVYKSIFTSHKSEKEQTRAHWVTYNPFYN